jgi:hypothetical protein
MGRIDLKHQWQDIKSRWLEAYNNNEVHPGESVTAYVDNDTSYCTNGIKKFARH